MQFKKQQMKLLMITKKVLLSLFVVVAVFAPMYLFAEETASTGPTPIVVTMSSPMPCIPVPFMGGNTCSQPAGDSAIQTYIKLLYQFAVGISGIVAVGMIVWGSIQISLFSESITQKSEGRDKITSAIIGVILLLGSYLLLNTINPRIVQLGQTLTTVKQATSSPDIAKAGVSSCGTSTLISGSAGTPIDFNVKPDAGNTCKYRKLFVYRDGFTISGMDAAYYGGSGDVQIAAQSVIWLYPYRVKGAAETFDSNGTLTSAKCIVYAYKEPSMTSIRFTNLQNTIEPCVLSDKQEDGYVGGPGSGVGNVSGDVKDLANQLGSPTSTVKFSTDNSCNPPDSAAKNILYSMQNGTVPFVCSAGCQTNKTECTKNGAYPEASLLRAIIALQNSKTTVSTVTSLTGGDHSANSGHYQGTAFDLSVGSGNTDDWNNVMKILNTSGVTAYCEYQGPGEDKAKLHTKCATGISGGHLHVQVNKNSNAINNGTP
ncbi:MAG: pilin [bacterium]